MPEVTISSNEAEAIRKECHKRIELRNALSRLMTNPDFKKVFMEEYLESEPKRLVLLLGDTVINQSEKKEMYRTDFHERMIGVARFDEFMRQIYNIANQAENQLNNLNQAEIVE